MYIYLTANPLTRGTGVDFSRVVNFEPAPVPVTTRDCDPHGFENPCHSLRSREIKMAQLVWHVYLNNLCIMGGGSTRTLAG
jgi:hypothetical protein